MSPVPVPFLSMVVLVAGLYFTPAEGPPTPSTAEQARPTAGQAMMMGPRQRPDWTVGSGPDAIALLPIGHISEKIARLKVRLGIKPHQMRAWNAFASALRSNAMAVAALRASQLREGLPPTLPLRLDAMLEMQVMRLSALQSVAPLARALYADLTPAQRQIMDEALLQPGQPL